MIITANTGRRLIREGKATITGFVWEDGDCHDTTEPSYVAIYNGQRTDHFQIDAEGLLEWMAE